MCSSHLGSRAIKASVSCMPGVPLGHGAVHPWTAALRTKRRKMSRWRGDGARVRTKLLCPHPRAVPSRSEEHTSELQSHSDLVCRLLLEKKKNGKSKHDRL